MEDPVTVRRLCAAASDALSRAGAQLRETVLAGVEGQAAARVVEQLAQRQGDDGLLWLLGDAQLLAVARWLDHRAALLCPPEDRCGDVLDLHDGTQVACDLAAGHDGHHGVERHAMERLRWVDPSWAYVAPPPPSDASPLSSPPASDRVTVRSWGQP